MTIDERLSHQDAPTLPPPDNEVPSGWGGRGDRAATQLWRCHACGEVLRAAWSSSLPTHCPHCELLCTWIAANPREAREPCMK